MALAKHQSHGLQHRVSPPASLVPSHQHYPRSTQTHLSLTCSLHWRTTSRRWPPKLLCNSSTHNKQGSIQPSSNKASSNRLSKCLSRPRTTRLSASNSSSSCNKVYKARTHSSCNNSSNLSNNCSHSSQVQGLGATHHSLSARQTALHRYLRTAYPTSRSSSSKCSCLLLQNQYSNSQHPPIPSASRCYPACPERQSPNCSATRPAQAHLAALQPTLSQSRVPAFSSNRRRQRARRRSVHHRSNRHLRRNNKHNHFSQHLQAQILLRETHRRRTPPHYLVALPYMRPEAQILLGKAHLSTNRPDKAGRPPAAARSAV